MEFGFSKEEEKVIAKVREFIGRETTPELLEETEELGAAYGGPEARKFIKKFASRGWLTPNWPAQYGGLDSSEMLTYIIRNEMAYSRLPLYFVGAHMAGPLIMRHGSEEMKREFLQPIARGEIEFSLGYSEPHAGSDLAALEMSAEDKGDYFLLNGQKIFNTSCHIADYHWLAVRTDVDTLKKHRGISMMIVDLKSEGVSIQSLITMAGWKTNEVYYDDVIVPKKNLVGEKNRGFYYMMEALDFERMFTPRSYRKLFDLIVDYVKTTIVNDRPLSKNPLIRQKLAQIAIELEVAELLYYQLAHILDKGRIPTYQSSMEKLFATEMAQRITNTGMEALGLYSQLSKDSKWAPLSGMVEHLYRWSVVETIYAGTSEIQRNIIALRGLGLPR